MSEEDNNNNNKNKKKLRVLTGASPASPATSNEPQKTVLPEVLPDPRRPPSATAPRARTIAHMQRLLATAAAVGVASVSCGKESKGVDDKRGCGSSKDPGYSVVDMLPEPAHVDASVDPIPSVNVVPEDASAGYAVVDPMPRPAHCSGLGELITSTARLVEQPGGAVHLVVTLSKPKTRNDFKYVSDAPAVGYGGTIVKKEVKPGAGATVTMKLDPGVADAPSPGVSISVKATCNQGPTTLSASITWTQPWKSATPSVHLNDY